MRCPDCSTQRPDFESDSSAGTTAAGDGFQRETQLTYPDAFARTHPQLMARVEFEGYVDEPTLAKRYASADILLHPALYESFGLIFLEAMRASLPTVTFRSGGASEVFANGESQGGVLCEPGDTDGLIAAVGSLARDPERRASLGRVARQAFESAYTSDRMALETAGVYERIVAGRQDRSRERRRSSRMFQIMEALQDRDAVSRIARTNASTLAELGAERPVMALFAEKTVRAETGRLRGARFLPGDSAIVHYWGFSRLERLIEEFPGRTAIHYHNITPPHFFAARTAHYEMTARGVRPARSDRRPFRSGARGFQLQPRSLRASPVCFEADAVRLSSRGRRRRAVRPVEYGAGGANQRGEWRTPVVVRGAVCAEQAAGPDHARVRPIRHGSRDGTADAGRRYDFGAVVRPPADAPA